MPQPNSLTCRSRNSLRQKGLWRTFFSLRLDKRLDECFYVQKHNPENLDEEQEK